MASPINYTVIFSEPVTGFDASDVVLGGTAGANSAAVTGSGTTYTVAVSGMSLIGTVTVSVRPGAATDAAGNQSLASTSTDNVVQFGGGLPDARIVPASSPLTLLLLILGVMVIAAGARLRR